MGTRRGGNPNTQVTALVVLGTSGRANDILGLSGFLGNGLHFENYGLAWSCLYHTFWPHLHKPTPSSPIYQGKLVHHPMAYQVRLLPGSGSPISWLCDLAFYLPVLRPR